MAMERIKSNFPLENVSKIARNPKQFVLFARERGQNVYDIITSLREVRESLNDYITRDPDLSIEVDADFKAFYKESNNTATHFAGLFAILKEAGITRTEIQSVMMDAGLPKNPDQIKEYIRVTEEAYKEVFKDGK